MDCCSEKLDWQKGKVNDMKKILFGIALILFGLSIAYISTQVEWAVWLLVALLFIFVGLGFSIFGFIEREK